MREGRREGEGQRESGGMRDRDAMTKSQKTILVTNHKGICLRNIIITCARNNIVIIVNTAINVGWYCT